MNRAVLLPLGLTPENVTRARPMSRALYDALPVGPELSVPKVPGAGLPAGFAGAPGPVGTVIVTPQISGPQQYSLVLSRRCADGEPGGRPDPAERRHVGGNAPVVVAPASLAKMPVVNGLDLSAYPDGPLSPVDLEGESRNVLVVAEDGRRGACARSGGLRADHPGRQQWRRASCSRWSRRTRPAAKPTASSSAPTTATGSSSPETTRARTHPNHYGGSRVPVCASASTTRAMLAQHWD